MNYDMRFGLNALPAMVSTDWILSAGRVKSSFVVPNCTRLSQCWCGAFHPNHSCWTVPILDWNALPAMVSTDWILSVRRVKVKSSVVVPNCTKLSQCLCGAFHPNHSCWTVPMSHCDNNE
eukprot:scaffold55313_cov77-Cyclotella_meneghiniana.AAC.5